MPTYDYKCLECAEVFEEFQSMSAEPLTECKFCKGKVKRLISGGAGLIFKGSGFYITDYRSDSYKKSESREKSSTVVKDTTKTKSDSKKKDSKTQSSAKTAS